MAEALADVMKEQIEKGDPSGEKSSRRKRRKTSPVTWLAFVVGSVFSAYIWFGSPSWLESAPPPLSPDLAEAGLRVEVFQQALLVEGFLDSQGRLPDDLAEAGEPFSAVEYELIDGQTYRLALSGAVGSVEYLSTAPLDEFLGDAALTVRQGG